MEENPFPGLKIDSSEFLDSLSGRSKCPRCQKSRKYYCYTCYIPVTEIEDQVPKVKVPVKIDVIKHPSEVDGKSTAVHAAVIAPDDVTIYTYPCIPEYVDKEKVLLVFPGDLSITLTELAKKWGLPNLCSKSGTKPSDVDNFGSIGGRTGCYDSADGDTVLAALQTTPLANTSNNEREEANSIMEMKPSAQERTLAGSGVSEFSEESKPECAKGMVPLFQLERVVFVDSTWNQTKTICRDERLQGLQCIELKTRETKFWRHQKNIPNTYLSTVEAIYYFLRDYHDHFIQSDYRGEYDNLLFFFTFMYKKIRTIYDGGEELRAYKQRKEK